jgi:hypothetical protein
VTVGRDQLGSFCDHPTSLKPLSMYLTTAGHPQDLRTVTAALVGIRFDLHRIIELLEQRHDRQQ